MADSELLNAIDGELSTRAAKRVSSHLAACWACRARRQELEGAIGAFVRFERDSGERRFPSPDGPRALLKAQLAEAERASGLTWLRSMTLRMNRAAVATVLLLVAGSVAAFYALSPRYRTQLVDLTVPDRSFTPGAAILTNEREVCSQPGIKNKPVPVSLQRRVFAEYGIRAAQPDAYEVDYLITPALGGADDIRNLWPQSRWANGWNAQVKDALEDHLRDLVCAGQLDLATAQREIAGNWIAAYKKYFHTDGPPTHSR